jgi:hypothetical protein
MLELPFGMKVDFDDLLSKLQEVTSRVGRHALDLPSSSMAKERWTALTRRAAATGHEISGANRSIDARSIVTIIIFFLVSESSLFNIHEN